MVGPYHENFQNERKSSEWNKLGNNLSLHPLIDRFAGAWYHSIAGHGYLEQ